MKHNRIRIAVAAFCFGVILISSLGGSSANMIPTPPPRSYIIIEEDGTINPPNAPIAKNENLYSLTANISCEQIKIYCSNIILDGSGFFIVGDVGDDGITVEKSASNVTVKNIQIQGYYRGIFVRSSNNTISNNIIWKCNEGITLWGSHNNITNNLVGFDSISNSIDDSASGTVVEAPFNYFRNNSFFEQWDISLHSNNNTFIDNNFFISSVSIFSWEKDVLLSNLFEGNYWKNYNGTDENGDGVGDSPHVVVTLAGSLQDSAPPMYPKNLSPNLLSLLNITIPETLVSTTPLQTQSPATDVTPTPSIPEFQILSHWQILFIILFLCALIKIKKNLKKS